MAQAKPVHEMRIGRIKAAVWRNESENGPRHNVTITRIYKTESGWNSSDSFGRDDLLLVAKIADMAHSWICQEARENEEHAGGAPAGRRQ